MTVGKQINRARIEAGYGLREFAELFDILPSRQCDIEHDRVRPSFAEQSIYATVLGMRTTVFSEAAK